jgi:hypothetical protein
LWRHRSPQNIQSYRSRFMADPPEAPYPGRPLAVDIVQIEDHGLADKIIKRGYPVEKKRLTVLKAELKAQIQETENYRSSMDTENYYQVSRAKVSQND